MATTIRPSVLAAMTYARNRYRQMPIPVRRFIDNTLGTGIYKKPMRTRGALFIHVPKSAGTAVARSLFGIRAVGHYTAEEAREYNPDLFAQLFTFAFVRHPITRAISAYNYLRTGGTPDVPVAFPKRYEHISNMSFGEFVEWLESIDVNRSNPVLHTQTRYVCDTNGELLVQYLGRFESIEQDFSEVCLRLGVDAQLQQQNVSVRKQLDPLDLAIEQRLRKIYAVDFENLGYE